MTKVKASKLKVGDTIQKGEIQRISTVQTESGYYYQLFLEQGSLAVYPETILEIL